MSTEPTETYDDDGIERPDDVALFAETGVATDDEAVGDWTGADDDSAEADDDTEGA